MYILSAMLILLKILPRLFTQTHLSLRLIYLLIILLWIEDVNKRIKMISLPHLHYRSNKSFVYYFRGILSCGYDKDMINSHLWVIIILASNWIKHNKTWVKTRIKVKQEYEMRDIIKFLILTQFLLKWAFFDHDTNLSHNLYSEEVIIISWLIALL